VRQLYITALLSILICEGTCLSSTDSFGLSLHQSNHGCAERQNVRLIKTDSQREQKNRGHWDTEDIEKGECETTDTSLQITSSTIDPFTEVTKTESIKLSPYYTLHVLTIVITIDFA